MLLRLKATNKASLLNIKIPLKSNLEMFGLSEEFLNYRVVFHNYKNFVLVSYAYNFMNLNNLRFDKKSNYFERLNLFKVIKFSPGNFRSYLLILIC